MLLFHCKCTLVNSVFTNKSVNIYYVIIKVSSFKHLCDIKVFSFNETELKKSELGNQTLAAPADNPPPIMENKELLGAGQEIKPPAVPTPAVRARALEDLLNPTINQGS